MVTHIVYAHHVLCQHLQVFLKAVQLLMVETHIRDIRCTASQFWRVLNELGVWRHEEYLARKVLRTSVSDVREIMPTLSLIHI